MLALVGRVGGSRREHVDGSFAKRLAIEGGIGRLGRASPFIQVSGVHDRFVPHSPCLSLRLSLACPPSQQTALVATSTSPVSCAPHMSAAALLV